jgi:hypothetical protein
LLDEPDPEPELPELVESEEPPQPASTAARPSAAIATVKAAAFVRRDRDLIRTPCRRRYGVTPLT